MIKIRLLINRYLLIFSDYKIHCRTSALFTGGPDIASVLLDDFLHNGKADAAAAPLDEFLDASVR